MSWFSAFAVFFIIWWIALFAVLPFGVRTQEDEDDVTLGTTESAPANFSLFRKVILTTIVSGIIFAGLYLLTAVFGFSFDDIPQIVPTFG